MNVPSFSEILQRFPGLLHPLQARRGTIPFIPQLTDNECGAACLAMVLEFHGRPVPLDELRNLAIDARDSTSATRLIETARMYGLRGRAVALDLEQLRLLPRGTILHWGFTHFVVLDRVTSTGVMILDPQRGRSHADMSRFGKLFTGVAILLEPTDDFRPSHKPPSGWPAYVRRLMWEPGFLPHILVTSLLLQVFGLGIPLISRVVVDSVIPFGDYQLGSVLAVAAGLLVIFQTTTSLLRSRLLLYLRARLDARMTIGFFDHMLSLPFDFFQRRSAGDLLARMNSNTIVRDILTNTLLSAVLDGALAIGYAAVLFAISPPLGTLAFLLALAQVVLVVATRRRQLELISESIEAQARSQSYLVETLSAVEAVKSGGVEHRVADRWSVLFANEMGVSVSRGKLDGIVESLRGGLWTAASFGLLSLAALNVMNGALSLGEMVAVIALATAFLTPVGSLVAAASRLQLLGVYYGRIAEVLETPRERDGLTQRAPSFSRSIVIEDVSFRYGPISSWVLRNVSLEIAAGEFVALVGASGAGKSTVARLLIALCAPTEGRVLLDGCDLQEVDPASVRRQVGMVTQQSRLFAGTIRSNIALADPDLPLAQVIEAARGAAIHEDIMAMPMGYDTRLGDRGASLSGGQMQRLCLARALVTNPRILVLDEATSQLDAVTERRVQDHLSALGCTRVIIAHRLSTIQGANRIVVLDAGRVVETGTHDQLLRNSGDYAKLVKAQLSVPGSS